MYIGGVTARINGAFGQGYGPIFLDDVGCRGTEDSLLDCPSRGIEVHNCNHARDAGVECVPSKQQYCIIQCTTRK